MIEKILKIFRMILSLLTGKTRWLYFDTKLNYKTYLSWQE